MKQKIILAFLLCIVIPTVSYAISVSYLATPEWVESRDDFTVNVRKLPKGRQSFSITWKLGIGVGRFTPRISSAITPVKLWPLLEPLLFLWVGFIHFTLRLRRSTPPARRLCLVSNRFPALEICVDPVPVEPITISSLPDSSQATQQTTTHRSQRRSQGHECRAGNSSLTVALTAVVYQFGAPELWIRWKFSNVRR